jgi:hypothetical protein
MLPRSMARRTVAQARVRGNGEIAGRFDGAGAVAYAGAHGR